MSFVTEWPYREDPFQRIVNVQWGGLQVDDALHQHTADEVELGTVESGFHEHFADNVVLEGPPVPPAANWTCRAASYRPSPGPNSSGYRADCDTSGTVAPGDYLDVSCSADSVADALPRSFVENNSFGVQDARTQYVYTIGPPYNCNYINGPNGGTRPITDWPSGLNPTNPEHPAYAGSDWLPWWAWELNIFGGPGGDQQVVQFGFKLPITRRYEGFQQNSPIIFTSNVDVSTPFVCSQVVLFPANTGGFGTYGTDCSVQLLPFPGWRCIFDAQTGGNLGYLGNANFFFRKMRLTGRTNGFVWDCDDRSVNVRYQCPIPTSPNRTILSDQWPSWGPGYPYEQIDRISSPTGTVNRFTVLIPQSVSPAAPFDAGEIIDWEIRP